MSIEVVKLLVKQRPSLKDEILNELGDEPKKLTEKQIEKQMMDKRKIHICGMWI